MFKIFQIVHEVLANNMTVWDILHWTLAAYVLEPSSTLLSKSQIEVHCCQMHFAMTIQDKITYSKICIFVLWSLTNSTLGKKRGITREICLS